MNTLQRGAWAGAMATAPMTLAMFKMHRSMPEKDKSPLPPARLTEEITRAIRPRGLSTGGLEDMTLLSHFAYGATCGLAYALLRKRTPNVSPSVAGGLFGVAVWGASYLGWIPAARLRPRATNMPVKRNAMMIIAHVVWGAALGRLESDLRKAGPQMLDGRRRPSKKF